MNFYALAISVPCAKCSKMPGEWCVTTSGIRSTNLHAARVQPMYDAYGVGYRDGSAESVSA